MLNYAKKMIQKLKEFIKKILNRQNEQPVSDSPDQKTESKPEVEEKVKQRLKDLGYF